MWRRCSVPMRGRRKLGGGLMITTILVIIAIALAVAIAATLIYAGTAPDTFTIQRSALIAAPPRRRALRQRRGLRMGRQSAGRRRAHCDHRLGAAKARLARA